MRFWLRFWTWLDRRAAKRDADRAEMYQASVDCLSTMMRLDASTNAARNAIARLRGRSRTASYKRVH